MFFSNLLSKIRDKMNFSGLLSKTVEVKLGLSSKLVEPKIFGLGSSSRGQVQARILNFGKMGIPYRPKSTTTDTLR